jgi:hypothetical protein
LQERAVHGLPIIAAPEAISASNFHARAYNPAGGQSLSITVEHAPGGTLKVCAKQPQTFEIPTLPAILEPACVTFTRSLQPPSGVPTAPQVCSLDQ